jgi:tetratricopeptide (TPR) repeat protein
MGVGSSIWSPAGPSDQMIRKPRNWTILAILSSIVCVSLQVPASATGGPRPPAVPKKPMALKSLMPEVDLTNEPDPSDVFDQAVKEYAAGHLPKAERLFEKAIYLDPSNPDAHFNLAAIKEWKNDWEGALGEYRAALRAKPGDKEIADAIRAVEYKIKNRTAIEAQMAKQKKDMEMSSHSRLARESFAAQDYAEAVIHLNYLAQVMPEDAKVQFALGQSLRALRNYEWAAYRLKMAIFLDPDNDLYRKTLVDLDKELQDITSQAYNETADRMLAHTENTQLEDIGLKNEQY